MTNFQWKITGIKVKKYKDLENVVVIVDWNYGDRNDVFSIDGSCQLNAPDVDKFINYADLIESDVIDWVKQVLGETYIENLQNKIAQNVDQIVNAPVAKPLPWQVAN